MSNHTTTLEPVHIVALRMAEFWDENGIESYKASHRDGVIFAAEALVETGKLDAMPDEATINAADHAGYALGEYGADWAKDLTYHVVIAAILMGEV